MRVLSVACKSCKQLLHVGIAGRSKPWKSYDTSLRVCFEYPRNLEWLAVFNK